ncbi:MAG: hypothetical protein RIS29_104 [Bacteroidota bacterium]|jgi:hypothetical protein
MKKLNIIVAAAIALVTFSACKSGLQIEKPRESYVPTKMEPAVSELPLKVEIDVKKLEAAVNAKMNGLIFDGSNLANKDLAVKVWKAQPFTFTINNNVIEYRIPLKLWTRFAWKVEKFGVAVGDNYEANGSIALTYKTAISIDKNWKLVSKTTGSGYEWIQKPQITAVGVNVPVTPVANLALSQCDKLITEQIDKSLSDMVELKKYVSQAWTEVQKARQVNQENNVWLHITPKDVYLTPFTTAGTKLNLTVSMYSQIESYIGAQPQASTPVALPAFKILNRPAQQFNLNVGADVTYAKISEMAKKQLLGKTFSEGKKTITITDLALFGSEGKPIFMADVIGSIKGRIYFTGNLKYNAEKTAVEITEPEFDLKTSNVLAKSAGWLLHGMILKQITPYLTYPVKDDIEKMKADVNKMLANYTIADGIMLQGKMNNASITNLTMVPGAVRMQANLKGVVGVKVQDMKL